jgi:hypothetical protein
MPADTAPAPSKQDVWVLAYILRFHGEEGEWAQVIEKTFATEEAARAHNAERNNAYKVCRVQIDTSEHHQRTQAASAAAWIAAREAAAEYADREEAYSSKRADTENHHDQVWFSSSEATAGSIASHVRALPPPADAMAALAEVVRVAVEKEREACALVVDSTPTTDQRAAREVMQRIRARSTERGA